MVLGTVQLQLLKITFVVFTVYLDVGNLKIQRKIRQKWKILKIIYLFNLKLNIFAQEIYDHCVGIIVKRRPENFNGGNEFKVCAVVMDQK